MGMFDTLYDEQGHDWQTKAFERLLRRYQIGDQVPRQGTYQVEVAGDSNITSYATVRNGVLTDVPAPRAGKLPLLDYHGTLVASGTTPDPLRELEQEVFAARSAGAMDDFWRGVDYATQVLREANNG